VNLLPSFLTHNASLKIASLAAAIFLWAIAPADPAQEESLTSVPVRVQVADLDWTLAGQPVPATVEVRLSGPAREIIRLAREGASVRVPVDTVTAVDTSVSLRRDWVTLGGTSGLVVEEVLPASVRLQFERVSSASLAVDLITVGDLPEEFALAAPLRPVPGFVEARGPERVLEDRAVIPTQPFDLSQLQSSGVRTVAVDTAGLSGTLLDRREVSVDVEVQAAVEMEIADVELRLVGPGASEYEVETATLPMRLRGAQAVLRAADFGALVYEVDTREIGILEVAERRTVAITPAGVPALLRAVETADSAVVIRPNVGGLEGPGAGGAR